MRFFLILLLAAFCTSACAETGVRKMPSGSNCNHEEKRQNTLHYHNGSNAAGVHRKHENNHPLMTHVRGGQLAFSVATGNSQRVVSNGKKMRSSLTAANAAMDPSGILMEVNLGKRRPTPEDIAIQEILKEQQRESEAKVTAAKTNTETLEKEGVSGGASGLLLLILVVCVNCSFWF
ncbi:hypothetical protein LSM04_003650 [Trypanosoma melophagium]|uniref:uncharacterized protein n=1 Tax=Trypanosoma melophagium TaxID=715481 RepID=UPI00351AA74B|nr:hypothetical protein LSM04_003650 [Trypanosoma melophagium]